MTFPDTIIGEAPARTVLRTALGKWWVWLLIAIVLAAAAAIVVTRQLGGGHQTQSSTAAWLSVSSSPAGAAIEVDGRQSGRTPTSIDVGPGTHHVSLAVPGYQAGDYQVDVAAGGTGRLASELWLAQPRVRQLLPPLPGATLAGASFLDDGRVALAVALPPGDERQLWLEGPGGEQRRLGPALARGSVALSPDGQRVAYLAGAANPGGTGQGLTQLWLSAADGQRAAQRYAVPTPTSGTDQLVDVSWAPGGRDLLLVSKQAVAAGGQRTALLWLSPDGDSDPRLLVSLPSDVVHGSYSWSPDGQWVAFLTVGTDRSSACLLGLPSGDFRYLGDVGSGGLSQPMPLGSLSWSADGRQLLYSAASGKAPAGVAALLGGGSPTALYLVDPSIPLPRLFNSTELESPTWFPDGSVVGLAKGKGNQSIVLRHITAAQAPVDGPPLPVNSGSTYGARWDVAHAQAIIAVRGDGIGLSGAADRYWLAQFRAEAPQ